MIVGSKIKEKRIAKGLSQQKLGDLLGVTKVSICGYEKGMRTPTLQNFIDLLEILDITPDELLGREVKVVSDKNENYSAYVAKVDLEIIKELKTHKKLYNDVATAPKRMIELLDRLYK